METIKQANKDFAYEDWTDFIIRRIKEDINTIDYILKSMLGPLGFEFCKKHANVTSPESAFLSAKEFAENDMLNLSIVPHKFSTYTSIVVSGILYGT